MIKRPEQYRSEIKEGYRGGEGTLQFTHLLEPHEYMEKGRLFGVLTLSPGGSIPLHKHQGDMEIFYVLAGQGMVLGADGSETPVAPGDTVVTPDGDTHGLRAVGETPLQYLAVILYA